MTIHEYIAQADCRSNIRVGRWNVGGMRRARLNRQFNESVSSNSVVLDRGRSAKEGGNGPIYLVTQRPMTAYNAVYHATLLLGLSQWLLVESLYRESYDISRPRKIESRGTLSHFVSNATDMLHSRQNNAMCAYEYKSRFQWGV